MSSRLLAVVLFACACSSVTAQDKIQLNSNSVRFAQQLIASGHFVVDKKGAWSDHRASVAEENQSIRTHGWSEYEKWHLAIDQRHRENSKARYKFPFGDFQKIHRCALIALRSRAREYGYFEIEKAAAELQRELDQKAKAAR